MRKFTKLMLDDKDNIIFGLFSGISLKTGYSAIVLRIIFLSFCLFSFSFQLLPLSIILYFILSFSSNDYNTEYDTNP